MAFKHAVKITNFKLRIKQTRAHMPLFIGLVVYTFRVRGGGGGRGLLVECHIIRKLFLGPHELRLQHVC